MALDKNKAQESRGLKGCSMNLQQIDLLKKVEINISTLFNKTGNDSIIVYFI